MADFVGMTSGDLLDFLDVAQSIDHQHWITASYSAMFLFVGCISLIYDKITCARPLKTFLTVCILLSSIAAIWLEHPMRIFLGLEVMAITAFLMVLNPTKHHATNNSTAIRYFLWHSIGTMMLLIPTSYHFLQQDLQSIYNLESMFGGPFSVNLSGLMESIVYCLPVISLSLMSAAFPFSSWFLRTYARTNSTHTITLSVITTKTAILLLLKMQYTNPGMLPMKELVMLSSAITIALATFRIVISNRIFEILLNLSLASIGFCLFGIASATSTIQLSHLSSYITYSVISLTAAYLIYGYIIKHLYETFDCKITDLPFVLNTVLSTAGVRRQFSYIVIISAIFISAAPCTALYYAKVSVISALDPNCMDNVPLKSLVEFIIKNSQLPFICGTIKILLPFLGVHRKSNNRPNKYHHTHQHKAHPRHREDKYICALGWGIVACVFVLNGANVFLIYFNHGVLYILQQFPGFLLYCLITIIAIKTPGIGRVTSFLREIRLPTPTVFEMITLISRSVFYIKTRLHDLIESFLGVLRPIVANAMYTLNNALSCSLTLERTILLSLSLLCFFLILNLLSI